MSTQERGQHTSRRSHGPRLPAPRARSPPRVSSWRPPKVIG
jgi:hypothetical protein